MLPNETPVEPSPIVSRKVESKPAPVVKTIQPEKVDSQEEKVQTVKEGKATDTLKKGKNLRKKRVPKQVSAKVSEVLKTKEEPPKTTDTVPSKEVQPEAKDPNKKLVPKIEKPKTPTTKPKNHLTLEDLGV